MAKAQLTERQAEIVDLLEKGKTPTEIGKKLKISTNGVYQQMRRIRKIPGYSKVGNTSGGSGGSTRKASASRSSGRKSTRTSTPAPSRPAPAAKPVTAREVLEGEVKVVSDQIAEQQGVITQAEEDIATAKLRIEHLTGELSARQDTLAVLTGEKVAHARPAQKPAAAKTNGSGSGKPSRSRGKGGEQATTETAPAEAQEATTEAATEATTGTAPAEAQAATPDPFEGGEGAQEAEAASDAAEAPQEAPAAA